MLLGTGLRQDPRAMRVLNFEYPLYSRYQNGESFTESQHDHHAFPLEEARFLDLGRGHETS
jgi:hypothetical protein